MSIEWLVLVGMALLLFAGMVSMQELGRRYGRSRAEPADGGGGTGAVEAAVFALMGLILAFQFNSSATRLESRRDLAMHEANAIGTAYLRLDLLQPQDQPPLRDSFRLYLEARIAMYQAIPDLAKVREQQQAGIRLQAAIWAAVVKGCERKPGISVLMFPALNEMIDLSATRDIATATHGSWIIVSFMFAVCLLAALVAGRAMARLEQRPVFHMVVFAAIAALTVYVILDLEYPRIGLIRIGVSDQAITDLRQAMR